MNPIILARAVEVVPETELLVNMVRLRVRQLSNGFRPLLEVPPGMGFSDIALSEIANGKLTSEPVDKSAQVIPLPIIPNPVRAGTKKAA